MIKKNSNETSVQSVPRVFCPMYPVQNSFVSNYVIINFPHYSLKQGYYSQSQREGQGKVAECKRKSLMILIVVVPVVVPVFVPLVVFVVVPVVVLVVLPVVMLVVVPVVAPVVSPVVVPVVVHTGCGRVCFLSKLCQ